MHVIRDHLKVSSCAVALGIHWHVNNINIGGSSNNVKKNHLHAPAPKTANNLPQTTMPPPQCMQMLHLVSSMT